MLRTCISWTCLAVEVLNCRYWGGYKLKTTHRINTFCVRIRTIYRTRNLQMTCMPFNTCSLLLSALFTDSDMKMWIHNELTRNSHERSKFSHYAEHWILFVKLWLLLLFLLGQVTLSQCDDAISDIHSMTVKLCFCSLFSAIYFRQRCCGAGELWCQCMPRILNS